MAGRTIELRFVQSRARKPGEMYLTADFPPDNIQLEVINESNLLGRS